MNIGKYKILIVKKTDKEPARLEKQEIPTHKLNDKLNIIIIILLLLLFLILCFLLVPRTYGFLWY